MSHSYLVSEMCVPLNYSEWDHCMGATEWCLPQNALHDKHNYCGKVENFQLKNISKALEKGISIIETIKMIPAFQSWKKDLLGSLEK